MASDVGKRVAEVILADVRSDEGFLKTAESLALYLVGSYIPGTLKDEETNPVAAAILEDLAGSGRFQDVETLATYVDEEMERVAEMP